MTVTLEVLQHASTVSPMLAATNSPYPPSFDNNPLVFGWALFARLLVFLLSIATLLRIRARNIIERLPCNDPTYQKRMVIACLLWAGSLGSGSDVLTYLFWGEVSDATTQIVLLLSRFMDAFTIIPFIMALTVPTWTTWLCTIGIMRRVELRKVDMMFSDMRSIWGSATVPLWLMAYSAAGAAMVTVFKYWVWLEHGRP